MPTLTIHADSAVKHWSFSGKQSLAAVLQQAGIGLQMPCGGNHTCGKCKVRCSGAFSPLTAEEAALPGGAGRRRALGLPYQGRGGCQRPAP